MEIELRKASGYALIIGLVSLFMVGVAFIAFNEPWNMLYDKFVTNGNLTASELTTAKKINSVWVSWPLLAILGIVLWVLLKLLKKEPDSGFL